MWSDNEAEIDLLNVEHLVGAVLRVVRDDRLDPVTVGVYGDWGSGKSSVIQLLRQRIATEPDLLAVYFNGWRFEGYEDAKAALASTILEQIQEEAAKPNGGKFARAKDAVVAAVSGLWDRVDKLRLSKQALTVGANAGLAAGALAIGATAAVPVTAAAIFGVVVKSLLHSGKEIDGEKLAELIKEREKAESKDQRDMHVSVRDFHKEFAKLVAQLGVKRLVVIVDDLDRCLPHNVIETLEAIRLFLAAPKTAFVIAADEALIREAVGYRFAEPTPVLGAEGRPRASIGARYLEKLIQVPIRVPPLSRSDLHGYLNLLFAEERSANAASFAQLAGRVRSASSYDVISFHPGNAENLLGGPISDDLKADFVLAEQIAPVLALTAEGNPRQTKRFLNALVLRLEMAHARGMTLDRQVAAKLLLLEYFLPELFRSLALEVAANEGQSPSLAALEADARTIGTTAGGGVRDGVGTGSTFATQAAAMRASDRFLTWVRTDPELGNLDLRPYVYFASERYALPVGVAQRLSPSGARALQDLRSDSEALHQKAAEAATGLPLPELTAIIGELTAYARTGRVNLDERTSPLSAMVEVAKRRPDVAPDVLASILGLPSDMVPVAAPVLVNALGSVAGMRDAATSALETLASSPNKAVKAAAEGRLRAVRDGSAANRGR